MSKFGATLTRIGLAKITNATALGTKVKFKSMAFGDGNGQVPEISEDDTQLVNEVYRGDINNLEIVDDTRIEVSRVIPANVGGFYVRELGIFDDEGDMIAVGKVPPTYQSTIDQGASSDAMFKATIIVANVEAVDLAIDPYVSIATKQDLEKLKDEVGSQTITDEVNHNQFRLIFRDNIPYFRVEEVN